MTKNNKGTLMTTFGTQLRPINLSEGIFVLTNDAEAVMDTPLPEHIGTKRIFKSGSTVKGTLWQESTRDGKTRKVVLVKEDLNGRYLINKNDLEPTSETKIAIAKSKEEIASLENKVEALLQEAKEEAKEIIDEPKGALEKEYFGFTGKQILIATLGVIVLIKVFK